MVEFRYNINSVDIDESEIVDYVKENFSPEDVFPEKELEYWAESNGFIKEEI
ncbi:MAG: hypothetical protein JRI32_10570 [Deltaproteobacteria bacterium]|nr:hypothetical protein [Deltaproteobacteria bacterium]